MGWVSTIEDLDDRLNSDMHLRGTLSERQLSESFQVTQRLHEECKAMLNEIGLIAQSLGDPSMDVAAMVADLRLELRRETSRTDSLREMLDLEKRAHRNAKLICRRYQERAEKAEGQLERLDENGSVAKKQGQLIAELRATIQRKNEELAKKERHHKKRRSRRPATQYQRKSKRASK